MGLIRTKRFFYRIRSKKNDSLVNKKAQISPGFIKIENSIIVSYAPWRYFFLLGP